MLAAAPVLNLSSNTKASIVYFRDLFKVRSWSWRDICVCAGACVCVCECLGIRKATCPWKRVWPWYWQSINKQCCVKGSWRHRPLSLSLCCPLSRPRRGDSTSMRTASTLHRTRAFIALKQGTCDHCIDTLSGVQPTKLTLITRQVCTA